MTHDELRAAAERVRAFTGEGGWYMIDRDADLVAARLLELLPPPDDGEPTDEAWLRSAGLTDPEQDCAPDKRYYGDLVIALVARGEDGFGSRFGFMYSDGHGGWSWWACLTSADGFDGSHDYLCPVPTRGHVRRLCRALGIELKEPK